jgi:glycosyltransferase involved in cell wall biosynthesis
MGLDYAYWFFDAFKRFESIMKILHVITSLQTGGAEKLIVDIVPKLMAYGHTVDVAIFNGESTPFKEKLSLSKCKIYSLGDSVYSISYVFKLMKIMKNYDIIHTHNSSPQLFVAIANSFCHKILVTTEHNTNNRKRGLWWFRPVDKWMYKKYQRIICISDMAETCLKSYLGNDIKDIVTIYNGVDVDVFHAAKSVDELKSDRFVIVMVAAFRRQKDQDTIVRAMALLPKDKYELWLVGEGERRTEVESLVAELKLNSQVKFFGNRTDVANILHTADVVVMSTHYEGLSLSNIEGMSAGKPFVASDVDGIHEVTAGYGILFSHQNEKKLADVILRLHDDKDYYKQVADACYERAKQFDISKMVDKYANVYDELMRNDA